MLGFLFSVIAGAAMSVQGVMNTRLQEGIGLWEANAYVQGTAFALSLAVMWLFGSGSWKAIGDVNRGYLLGGALGLVITVTVMLSIKGLDATVAISTILIAQLLVAALIDALGWMGQEKVTFGVKQYLGVALMLGGVVLFKLKYNGSYAALSAAASAFPPSSRAVVMSLSWVMASLRLDRLSLTFCPLDSLAS